MKFCDIGKQMFSFVVCEQLLERLGFQIISLDDDEKYLLEPLQFLS